MREILRRSTAKQAKWICRIILKDLKIGLSHEKALNFFHPDVKYINIYNFNLINILNIYYNIKIK